MLIAVTMKMQICTEHIRSSFSIFQRKDKVFKLSDLKQNFKEKPFEANGTRLFFFFPFVFTTDYPNLSTVCYLCYNSAHNSQEFILDFCKNVIMHPHLQISLPYVKFCSSQKKYLLISYLIKLQCNLEDNTVECRKKVPGLIGA